MPEEAQDLWHSILSDVASHTASRRLPPKDLLVLGDEGAGKSSLIFRLQGRKQLVEESTQGTGLEYTFLDVKDEDSGEDVIGRLGVYTLDGSTDHRTLLQFVVSKETLENIVVVIVLDYLRPWTMLQSLEHWMKTLEAHLQSLGSPKLEELQKKMVCEYQQLSEGGTIAPEDKDDIMLPLEEGVLSCNLGLPVIVVCNKSDGASHLEKDMDYRNEHLDFIQMHLRKACLRYGAALLYNGKDGRTRETLVKYIFHRAYGFPFSGKANIAERDSIFVPTGWDSHKKIAMLHAGLKAMAPNDAFEDHIVSLQPRKAGPSRDAEAEDEQEFLRKQQAQLATNPKEAEPARRSVAAPAPAAPASAPRTSSPLPSARPSSATAPLPSVSPSAPSAGARLSAAPVSATPPAATAGKDGKPAAGTPQNTDVLAQFFNSLLKKPGGAPAPAKT